jgi:tetratricopeptide (TPR) repeat protein
MSNPSRLHQLQEMLKAEPNDAFLNYALAVEFEKEGRIDEATVHLQNMIKSHPEYLPIYYKLGKLFEDQQQFNEAKKSYLLGKDLAVKQYNKKTLNELEEALWLIEDEE